MQLIVIISMKTKRRTRIYIDCPYCRNRKGRLRAIKIIGDEERDSTFVEFEDCYVCGRSVVVRLGKLKEMGYGKT